jgi:hypothetical protein
MIDPVATLALAERVAAASRRLGFETVLIGAGALAVHRYTRGTEDIDLGCAVDPRTQLVALQRTLEAEGLETTLRFPDDIDPLGGVLLVFGSRDAEGEVVDRIDVVNFRNPANASPTPAIAAIARARPLPGSALRCVTLEDLVALKCYAGGLSDLADIERLLAVNPEADLEAIRSVAAPFDRAGQLDALLARAAQRRGC